MFDEILVIDYISSYSDLTSEQKVLLKSKVINGQFLINCPNGSIIAVPISTGQTAQARVYYPFFSHMRVPIKAGERAWACLPNAAGAPYWLSRKVQNMTAEDPNFTHDDRAFAASQLSATQNSSILIDAGRSGRPLDKVRSEALSRIQFAGRPVLLAKGKSPDFIIQGSNSTSIKLSDETPGGTGLIQIVAGSGKDREQRVNNNLANVTNNGSYFEFIKPTPPAVESSNTTLSNASIIELAESPPEINIRSDSIGLGARGLVYIGTGNSTITVHSNGEVVITPGTVVKLAGDESDQAYLRYDQFKEIINLLIDMVAALQSSITIISAAAASSAAGGPTAIQSAIETATLSDPGTIAIDAYTQQINTLLNTIKSTKILGT